MSCENIWKFPLSKSVSPGIILSQSASLIHNLPCAKLSKYKYNLHFWSWCTSLLLPSRDITSDCVCNQAGGCTAHVLPVWVRDGTSAQLHYMNQTDGPLPSLKVMLYIGTHIHTQTKEWDQTIHIRGATDAFLHLLMIRGKWVEETFRLDASWLMHGFYKWWRCAHCLE